MTILATTTPTDGRWSGSVSVGLPILIVIASLLAVVLVAAIVKAVIDSRSSRYETDPGFWIGFAAVPFAVLLIVAGIAAAAYYPYKAEYHQWRPVSGQVEQIESRLLPSGESMQEKFVVQLTDGRQYAIEDTRAALIARGDHVKLECVRRWQWAGVDGYDCRYVSHQAGESE